MVLTPVKIIISASAGSAKNETGERLAQIFAEHQVAVEVSVAETGAELTRLARDATRAPHKTIIAAGGDGTVNSVATEVVDSGKILGVLPLGTLNHFARDLRIPFEVEAAVRTIVEGHTIEVDVAAVNDRVFLNNSSLGLYPIIVREREKRQRLGLGKWPAFVWATIQALRRYPFLDVRLRVDGEWLARTTPFVFIGNNEYVMDLFNIGVRERLDRGVLTIYITNRTSRLRLMGLAVRAVLGRLREDKDFLELRSSEVKIHTGHKRLRVALDGELTIMQPPLDYRVRSRALRVIVPQDAE